MKLSVNWLKEYVDFGRGIEEMAQALTMAGLEVEESEPWSREDFTRRGGAGLADDTVWNVKVTPNRGDWLSIAGVARECAAIAGARARLPQPSVATSKPAASEFIDISIEDPDLCRRYVGVVVRGSSIGESPGWMKDRLVAAGMRPINNVVDITNYVMLELGQPLHAFDLKLLHGGRIIVRRAKPGETIVSIDGEERKLDTQMLVIADADRAVAIAGVMGGIDSEINDRTCDILIESANFDPASIRRTSKQLGMVTESSYRFERCVDPSVSLTAALRAAELIVELAGGTAAEGAVDVYPGVVDPWEASLRPERANAVLGTSLSAGQMASSLEGYEIGVRQDGNRLLCTIPTFRPDLTKEIDLIEEIGRAFGYDNLSATLPSKSLPGTDSPAGKLRDIIRRILMACGGQEVLTHSLVDSRLARLLGREQMMIPLRNPLSEDSDSMRVMLAPNLLQVIQRNQAAGTDSLFVFETGKVYYRASDGAFDEKLSVAGAMVGDLWAGSWNRPKEALEADFFLCKGAVESLLGELGVRVKFEAAEDALLHPTRAAAVVCGGERIGLLGEVAPRVREVLDVRGRACIFELDFDRLQGMVAETRLYREISRYPATERHLSIVAPSDVSYGFLEEIASTSGGELVESIQLLDVYCGEPLGENTQGITLSIVFRSKEKTLTDEEVNGVLARIRDSLASKAGVSFR